MSKKSKQSAAPEASKAESIATQAVEQAQENEQQSAAPEASKAESDMQALSAELAKLRVREQEIRLEMQAVSEKERKESARVTAVDHQKALRAASEELRKAGMIPGPGSRRFRQHG